MNKEQPKCKTCGGKGIVNDIRIDNEGCEFMYKKDVPCPDCQQPTAGDFTKEIRASLAISDSFDQTAGKPSNPLIKPLLEACDRLDTAEARLKVICEAIKIRIAFIGLPSEPMNESGPDWSKEVALLEEG